MQNVLFIDIETYSEESIENAGLYKYIRSAAFEIMIISYALNDEPVKTIDLCLRTEEDERRLEEFEELFFDESVLKVAHNAMFERVAFNRTGYNTQTSEWLCTMVLAGYCGYPLKLEDVSKILTPESAKLETGKILIKLFCMPQKIRKSEETYRIHAYDRREQWELFKEYCERDVEAERAIYNILIKKNWPAKEKLLYSLDQKINDRGVSVDITLSQNAIKCNELFTSQLAEEIQNKTGIANPNSGDQIKAFIFERTGDVVESITAKTYHELLAKYSKSDKLIVDVLKAKKMLGKTSIKKYETIIDCNIDSRAYGLFQFYGATKTGRWAGRLIQLHNLKRNKMKDLVFARDTIKQNTTALPLIYDDVPSVLSELIRTAIVPSAGKVFCVSDYSSIEARVLAWLAGEEWKLEIFRTHGKIYEAMASKMFNVPIESVGEGSDMRQQAKTAELAFGYEGAVQALLNMGGDALGLSMSEMKNLVRMWRDANPNIVDMWAAINKAAMQSIVHRGRKIETPYAGISFITNESEMRLTLPSGRQLFYVKPHIANNRFKQPGIFFYGIDQDTKMWSKIDTYGGKLVENIVQATARDIMGEAFIEMDKDDIPIVLHVHDEIAAEVPIEDSENTVSRMVKIMSKEVPWAKGLPLSAKAFITDFYKKD